METSSSNIFAVRCGVCNTPATLGWNDTEKKFLSMCEKCQTYTTLDEALLEKVKDN